jgi:hypothetical protein
MRARLMLALLFGWVPLIAQPPAAPASTTTSPAPAATCPSFFAAGASYQDAVSPKFSGWWAVATLLPGVKCDPTKHSFQPLSFTQTTVAAIKSNGVNTLQTTTSSGIAFPFQKITSWLDLYLLGTVGAAVAGSTSTVTLGTAYGGMAAISIPKTSIIVTPAIEWVNGTRSTWLGFARTF